MAGDWIKIRTDLYRDPKVAMMSESLFAKDGDLARYVNQFGQRDMSVTRNVMRNAVVGALVSVWGIARHQGRRDGDDLRILNCELWVLDDISDLPGFGAAMVLVGWCVEDDSGLCFPRFFAEHNTDPREKAQAQNRERQRRYRDSKRNGDSNVTDNVTVTPRVEKSREESITKGDGKKPSHFGVTDVRFPDGMNTPAVKSAVDSWLTHKRSRGKGYKSAAQVEILIRKWLMAGPLAFIDAIENSIANNYDGVHAGGPRPAANQQHRRETPAEARERSNADAITGFLRASGVREGDDGALRLEANGEPPNG